MTKHCCEMMRSNVEGVCRHHSDRRACPDALLFYSESSEGYSILIHDGEDGYAASGIAIAYCPWCGTPLVEPVCAELDDVAA